MKTLNTNKVLKSKHYYSIIKNYFEKESDIVIIENLTSRQQTLKCYKVLKEMGIDTKKMATIIFEDYQISNEDLYGIRELI